MSVIIEGKEYWTTKEVAEKFGIQPGGVLQLTQKRLIPHIGIRTNLYPAGSVDMVGNSVKRGRGRPKVTKKENEGKDGSNGNEN